MSFPELITLETELKRIDDAAVRVEKLAHIADGSLQYPIYGITVGSTDPEAPCLMLTGGVHGIERIGAQVVIAYMTSVFEKLKWSPSLKEQLKHMRIAAIPIVNPVGVARGTRCSSGGVDLMRNAPVDSATALTFFGGHRISSRLPYFRGSAGAPLEPESKVFVDFIEKNCAKSKFSVLLDVHSGFGGKDRLWCPWGTRNDPYFRLPEAMELFKRFEQVFPSHVYHFEPQSVSYTVHGDLIDYLVIRRLESPDADRHVFLPLTLEMGSWLWVKKNPAQLFSFLGGFNPTKPHRRKRVLRRHVPFLDFLKDAVEARLASFEPGSKRREEIWSEGCDRWFEGRFRDSPKLTGF
jgi:hypothetical protein